MRWLRGMTAIRLLFLVAVLACAAGTAALTSVVLDASTTQCHAINRGLSANRAVFDYMRQTVEASWAKHPPTDEQRTQAKLFFAGVTARLAPVEC